MARKIVGPDTIEDQNDEINKAGPVGPNGIVVIVESDPDGELNLQVQKLGNTEITSIPTVLKLAAKQVDEQLGI